MVWEEGHWTGPRYDANGKMKTIILYRFDRPHMRAFHFAWLAFIMCFIMWFAIPPLMPTIKKSPCQDLTSNLCIKCLSDFPSDALKMATDKVCKVCAPKDVRNNAGCGGLGLVKSQIVLSNATSVLGTIMIRILIGAVADAVGVRYSYFVLLMVCSIPGFCIAAVQTVDQFIAVRFLISFVGGSFVLTQLWTSLMFSPCVVGLANATTAGWGNLGGAVAAAVMPSVFTSFIDRGQTNDSAWRNTLVWPPAVMIALAMAILFMTDDTPTGRYADLRKKKLEAQKAGLVTDDGKDSGGEEPASIATRSLKLAFSNWRTWILFIAYAYSFGVEVSVYNNIPLYFNQAFSLNQTDASLSSTLFGCFNLFARSLGGFFSDKAAAYVGIRGRLWVNFCCSLGMGAFLLIFSNTTKDKDGLGGAMGALAAWGFFLAMTEGAVYGVVPFVEPTAVGGVAGIVGAGGNAGALGCNFMMAVGQRPAFQAIGWLSMFSAMLIPLLWLPGHGSMFRTDAEHKAPASAPVKEVETIVDESRDLPLQQSVQQSVKPAAPADNQSRTLYSFPVGMTQGAPAASPPPGFPGFGPGGMPMPMMGQPFQGPGMVGPGPMHSYGFPGAMPTYPQPRM
jgi:NNP family nitrate/nitrite transporter-like MFS transporter